MIITLKNVLPSTVIVCTLADGSTLRVQPGAKVDIPEENMTEYLYGLINKKPKPYMIISSHKPIIERVPASEKTGTSKLVKNSEKDSDKDKEE